LFKEAIMDGKGVTAEVLACSQALEIEHFPIEPVGHRRSFVPFG